MGYSLMFVFAQKDIVLVSFPFTDRSSTKQRPVLIISNNQINGSGSMEDFICVALTRTLRRTDYSIVIETGDCENGGLPFISEIQCGKIATLCKDLVVKKFCTVKDDKFHSVKEVILKAIDAGKN